MIEKPGTGIFLMKEHAKLVKVQKNRTSFSLSKRLGAEDAPMQEEEKKDAGSNKRKNLGGGRWE